MRAYSVASDHVPLAKTPTDVSGEGRRACFMLDDLRFAVASHSTVTNYFAIGHLPTI